MSDTLDILVRLETKVDVLNSRMDRHETKNDARFNSVFQKIDDVSEKIHAVAMDATKEDGKIREGVATMSGELKARIAGLSGTVALIVSALMEWIKHAWNK